MKSGDARLSMISSVLGGMRSPKNSRAPCGRSRHDRNGSESWSSSRCSSGHPQLPAKYFSDWYRPGGPELQNPLSQPACPGRPWPPGLRRRVSFPPSQHESTLVFRFMDTFQLQNFVSHLSLLVQNGLLLLAPSNYIYQDLDQGCTGVAEGSAIPRSPIAGGPGPPGR